MIGIAIDVIAKPMVVIATLAREKLRSPKRPSGTSGSRAVVVLPTTNPTSTTTPATIIRQTVISPVIRPQSNWWPSWMPNTSRNMPAR